MFGIVVNRYDVMTVAPIWFWHEARQLYRPFMRSRRKW